jgi:chromosome segregation ATPase
LPTNFATVSNPQAQIQTLSDETEVLEKLAEERRVAIAEREAVIEEVRQASQWELAEKEGKLRQATEVSARVQAEKEQERRGKQEELGTARQHASDLSSNLESTRAELEAVRADKASLVMHLRDSVAKLAEVTHTYTHTCTHTYTHTHTHTTRTGARAAGSTGG